MTTAVKRERPLTLKAATAADLMNRDPVSIRAGGRCVPSDPLEGRGAGNDSRSVNGGAGRPAG